MVFSREDFMDNYGDILGYILNKIGNCTKRAGQWSLDNLKVLKKLFSALISAKR
jgi:hypothetical protein